jgi:hypothetical protein
MLLLLLLLLLLRVGGKLAPRQRIERYLAVRERARACCSRRRLLRGAIGSGHTVGAEGAGGAGLRRCRAEGTRGTHCGAGGGV